MTALALGALVLAALAGAPSSRTAAEPPKPGAAPAKPVSPRSSAPDRSPANQAPQTPQTSRTQARETATPELRIRDAFVRLGMEAKRSACYGRVIAGALDDAQGARAAGILEGARGAQDVRDGVTRAGGSIMAAFLLARLNCG